MLRSQATAARPWPWRALALLAMLVLLLHTLLLGLWSGAQGVKPSHATQATQATQGVMQLRQIGLVAQPVTVQPAPTAPARSAAPDAARRARADAPEPMPSTPPVWALTAARGERELATGSGDELLAPGLGADAPPGASELAAQPGDDADAQALPAYATQHAPPATLHYMVRRGGAVGRAELVWRPEQDRYALTLRSSGGDLAAPGSFSRGGFDAAGLAPERFVDRRRGRDVRAANFRRELGQISFSGPRAVLPLHPGTQDRLSWMLQLPAILEANPHLTQPGALVALRVVGARGHADIWTFEVVGHETIELPGSVSVGALHLLRQARRPYELQVALWLDPNRHHLPLRMQWGLNPGAEATEFWLERVSLP